MKYNPKVGDICYSHTYKRPALIVSRNRKSGEFLVASATLGFSFGVFHDNDKASALSEMTEDQQRRFAAHVHVLRTIQEFKNGSL